MFPSILKAPSMKTPFILLYLSLAACLPALLSGQRASTEPGTYARHTLAIELIPWGYLQTGQTTGLQAGYEYSRRRWTHAFTAGMVYDNFHSGLERETVTVNGQPPAGWSTEVDIFTTRPYPLGGVVNELDFRWLESWGFRHSRPKQSYRLNRYLTYECLYHIVQGRRFSLRLGPGITAGLTNRDDTVVGFTGDISSGVTGHTERFWININVRARYLYWGPAARLVADYRISERFSLGLSGGLHYIFAKGFREDVKMPYLGVRTVFSL